MFINEQIKQLRQHAEMTLKQLAETSGLSISYLSDIERGRTNPSLDTIENIAKALGLEANFSFISIEKFVTNQLRQMYVFRLSCEANQWKLDAFNGAFGSMNILYSEDNILIMSLNEVSDDAREWAIKESKFLIRTWQRGESC